MSTIKIRKELITGGTILVITAVFAVCGVLALKSIKHIRTENATNPMVYKLDDSRLLNSIKLKRRIPVVIVVKDSRGWKTIQNVKKPTEEQTITNKKFQARYNALCRLNDYEYAKKRITEIEQR